MGAPVNHLLTVSPVVKLESVSLRGSVQHQSGIQPDSNSREYSQQQLAVMLPSIDLELSSNSGHFLQITPYCIFHICTFALTCCCLLMYHPTYFNATLQLMKIL